ncbi:uncharacterized protein UV8b_01618 [Ustilaginoidea virens]|uniref:Zn(2)-C6 fungal-type domain-containing protein n=1 Tax=Ustilaginoidea virens TaxID=1159556 RepID=A0A1B5KSG3_USTVR|nr:uncharacterized protein UV8b_01618 [Ustilaginoidea virens]QUC17377.1 hypothetical protein UV8b_01618 [Ustilaginoidea virens]GAO13738.1 hypothetical protein UVI_02018350 [Ustilaginoidea virens]
MAAPPPILPPLQPQPQPQPRPRQHPQEEPPRPLGLSGQEASATDSRSISGPGGGADAGVLANGRPGKRPAARGTAFYPRKRANTACQVCRARKTKCDNRRPSCSYCLSVGAACIQSAFDLSSFDPASLKILDRLDDLERLLRANAAADACAALATVPGLAASSSLPFLLQSSHLASPCGLDANGIPTSCSNQGQAYDPGHGISSTGTSASKQVPTSDRTVQDQPVLDSVLPPRIDRILEWPILCGSKTHGSPVYRVPPDAVCSPVGASSLAALVDMESHRIYRLLDNFFLYIHCKNPILDESSARRMVGRAFLDGIDWSPASCLAMVICALGCIATPFGPSPETRIGTQAYADSQVFFQAAQKRIGIMLARSDIVGAQCLFLSGVYMMMVFQPIYAWRFFSQALAACQHFPFLAKAQDMPTGTPGSPAPACMGRQDTQEQALYWSAWKSERELRGELSLPDFDIHHSGSTLYPPFFPAPPAPPPDSPDGPDSEAQRSRASWLFYLAEISLRRLTSRLCSEVLSLRQRYASNSAFLDVLADVTAEYEAQAQEWSDSLPGELSIRSAIDEDGIARSVLRGKLINLYEMVYWPFVMVALSAAAGGQSLKPQYAELARRGLDTHMHQIRANEPGFHHRHHGGFFMIRACARSAFSLVAAAKSGMSMPAEWDAAVHKVIGMMAYWEEEDGDVAAWRSRLEREAASAHELS